MAKIAIIEDEHAIAEMYRFKLEADSYEVRCAYDGVSGLALVEAYHPDLLLLDLMMPQMPGHELLQKIQSEDWSTDMKVIVLTNLSKDVAPPLLSKLRYDRYIVKAQFTPTQIVALVSEVLKGKKESKK